MLLFNIFFNIFFSFNNIISVKEFSSLSDNYINLINWISNNSGFISEKVAPIEISPYNRIMKSSTIISKDEVISFIPEKLVISSINYEVNPICRRAYGLYHKSDLECIIFFLTLDKNNQSSFFKPYYDYLPKLDINIFPSEYSEEKLKLYEELEFDLHVGISNNKLKNAFNEEVEKMLKEKK